MNHTRIHRLLLWLYAHLLRLYPRPFREAFAAEMLDVMRQRLADSQPGMFFLGTREITGLLVSVVRERLATRRRHQLELAQHGGLVAPLTTYRFCTGSLFLFLSAFVALLIVPFYAYGLHLQPAAYVMGGSFDPKGFPLYDPGTLIGAAVHMLAVLAIVITPVWTAGFGTLLAFTMGRYWFIFAARQRRLGLLAVALSAGLFVLFFSPPGRMLLAWFMD